MIANWYKNLSTILQNSNVMNPDMTDPVLFRWAQLQEIQDQITKHSLLKPKRYKPSFHNDFEVEQ
jgi:hypothetical protein